MPDGAWIKYGVSGLRVYTYQGKYVNIGVAGDGSITIVTEVHNK